MNHSSVESGGDADAFLDDNKNLKVGPNVHASTASRHRSVADTEKEIRNSIGYALKNKHGEGARDDTDSDDDDPANKHLSTKQRMSKKIGGKLTNC